MSVSLDGCALLCCFYWRMLQRAPHHYIFIRNNSQNASQIGPQSATYIQINLLYTHMASYDAALHPQINGAMMKAASKSSVRTTKTLYGNIVHHDRKSCWWWDPQLGHQQRTKSKLRTTFFPTLELRRIALWSWSGRAHSRRVLMHSDVYTYTASTWFVFRCVYAENFTFFFL